MDMKACLKCLSCLSCAYDTAKEASSCTVMYGCGKNPCTLEVGLDRFEEEFDKDRLADNIILRIKRTDTQWI